MPQHLAVAKPGSPNELLERGGRGREGEREREGGQENI